jgi:hypothetical protein
MFISVSLAAGVGASVGSRGVTIGWVGPPGPANTPSDPEVIYQFVNGADLSGGFAIGLFTLGLGFTALENPSNGLAGEEIALSINGAPGAAAFAGAGESCSFSFETTSQLVIQDMQALYNNWSTPPGAGNNGLLTNQLTSTLADMSGARIDTVGVATKALQNCNPL